MLHLPGGPGIPPLPGSPCSPFTPSSPSNPCCPLGPGTPETQSSPCYYYCMPISVFTKLPVQKPQHTKCCTCRKILLPGKPGIPGIPGMPESPTGPRTESHSPKKQITRISSIIRCKSKNPQKQPYWICCFCAEMPCINTCMTHFQWL